MDVAGIALGASLVEKTITLYRTTRSIGHIMSLESGDMRQFIQTTRNLEIALGNPRRIMHPQEIKKRQGLRRSIY
jgi:N,N'-diacetyllegionaminate synthase